MPTSLRRARLRRATSPYQGATWKGVHFALDMLAQQNRVLAGAEIKPDELVSAKGKDVLVIGGGDTGSDCIGTAHRQGCKSVTQIEIMPKPPVGPDDPQNPWPAWPRTLKTTSSHEEGCVRRWNVNSLRFIGKDGKVTGVEVQEIAWKPNPEGGRPIMEPVGKPEVIKADMVLLAMGFLEARAAAVRRERICGGRRCQRRFARGPRHGERTRRGTSCRQIFVSQVTPFCTCLTAGL